MDFSADADYHGTVGITLIVCDGPTLSVDKRGRTDEVTLDVSIDRGAIYGVKWNDENKDGMKQDGEFGVEGVRIFVDENGDGQYTDGERETWTDANGQYAFLRFDGRHLLRRRGHSRQRFPRRTHQLCPIAASKRRL